MTPATETLFPMTAVGRLLRASAAYHAALANAGRLPSYLAAVAAALGADQAALLTVRPQQPSLVVLATHNAPDADRLARLGRPPYLPGVGTVTAVVLPERGGPALVADADGVRLCVLYHLGGPPPGVADIVAITLLCRTCDPANLIGTRAPASARGGDVAGLPDRLGTTLQGLLAGQTERQIGTAMGISRHTVHVHVKALYRRFGVSSRAGLLSLFIADGPPPQDSPAPVAVATSHSDGQTPGL